MDIPNKIIPPTGIVKERLIHTPHWKNSAILRNVWLEGGGQNFTNEQNEHVRLETIF